MASGVASEGRADGDTPSDTIRRPTEDDREAALEMREVRSQAREARQDDRDERVQSILDAADARDAEADARDAVADKRDEAASLHAFLSDPGDYRVAINARQSAALDRSDSKFDRDSSAEDRSKLTGVTPPVEHIHLTEEGARGMVVPQQTHDPFQHDATKLTLAAIEFE